MKYLSPKVYRKSKIQNLKSKIGFCLSLALAVVSGCSTTSTRPKLPDSVPRVLAISGVQYAYGFAGAGYNTVEIFISNTTDKPVTFTGVDLDGVALPSLSIAAVQKAASAFNLGMDGVQAKAPIPSISDNRITWWQFYPSATVQSGETILCQVGFKGGSSAHTLSLHTKNAQSVLSTSIPRYTEPADLIRAVTWSADEHTLFVQYTASAPLIDVAINGISMEGTRILQPAREGAPFLVAVPLASKMRRGDSLLIELTFENGAIRRELLRVAPGIHLDAGDWSDKPLPAATLSRFLLDVDPAIAYHTFDVACDDSRVKRPGESAMRVVDSRSEAYKARYSQLAGIDFCTATTEQTWNIYGHITDAVFVKPYRLHWGNDPMRFIEAEEECVMQAVVSAAPRPALWVPERFKRERHIEAPEMRLMAWNALLSGARGIRYHFWKNEPRDNPFRDCPELETATISLNADIRKIKHILGALVPVRAETDRRQGVKVREAWSGDAGVLLLVRDMLYTTDAASDAGGIPRFQPGPTRPVTVTLDLPPWLSPGAAVDPLSEAAIPMRKEGVSHIIDLPEFSPLQLVWIPNTKK